VVERLGQLLPPNIVKLRIPRESTCVAINKCSRYLDFGAASLTLVAPINTSQRIPHKNQCFRSEAEIQKNRWGRSRFGNTFNRLFVSRRHDEQLLFFPRLLNAQGTFYIVQILRNNKEKLKREGNLGCVTFGSLGGGKRPAG
jgi:hypothetical protein